MRKKGLKEIILKASEGLFATTTDIALYLIFLTGASFFKPYGSRGVYQAFTEADEALKEVNYQTIKMALVRLKKQGLVTKEIEITKAGLRRINEIIPSYDKKRIWDKKIYLVTYDIPTSRNRDRDLLREYLKRIGCALLQESVWLTPYNPKRILATFADGKNLAGTILVSDLGLDGGVGEEDIKTLVKRVYHLTELNEEYQNFLDQYSQDKRPSSLKASFDFYQILQKDPQLPFELLPEDWQGEKAYQLFLKITKGKSILFDTHMRLK